MKNRINISIAIIVIVFITIVVATRLFKIADLPLQTIGVLFGAVITALITYFLLLGQSQAEENKERNVRVFDEKSKRYNIFIDKLWEIWDDREVTLEELNQLIGFVSKDIILYTKSETVDRILTSLINIAEIANPDKSNIKDEKATKTIQENIFLIINELAIEIGLGGKIEKGIQEKLNKLEEKVVPYLIKKDFKEKYIKGIKSALQDSDEVDFSEIEYSDKYLRCRVKDSNVYFVVGPFERALEKKPLIGIHVEFWGNRNYQKYRDASRGWRKEFLKGGIFWHEHELVINFNDLEKTEKLYHKFKQENYEISKDNKLVKVIIEHYKNWNIDGKNIENIIEECTSQN